MLPSHQSKIGKILLAIDFCTWARCSQDLMEPVSEVENVSVKIPLRYLIVVKEQSVE